ncbi:MAG: myxosortase-dependent metalloprotease, MXAN_2677/MXAN_2678 family [Archangium sp.]|nr:myxosortase-dependent metalloprotease, MXAN_2677/MXAN_2678 family [Archangium sp.]
MLSAQVVVALVLTQYVRSHVDRDDPSSPCLWWQENSVIAVEQSTPGNPETMGTEFAAVSAALATWGAPMEACGSIRFDELPRTPSRVVAEDGRNVVLFRLVDCNDVMPACSSPATCGNQRDCWEHANGALAITSTFYDHATGRISDSDVEFNTPGFLLTTVDSPVCVAPNFNLTCVASDIQNTMTHEAGHLLGLTHSPDPASTMALRAVPGELSKRVLDADSTRFICNVYPAGKAARGCQEAFDGELGKAAGCATMPGAALAVLALLLARRWRSRRPGALRSASPRIES